MFKAFIPSGGFCGNYFCRALVFLDGGGKKKRAHGARCRADFRLQPVLVNLDFFVIPDSVIGWPLFKMENAKLF